MSVAAPAVEPVGSVSSDGSARRILDVADRLFYERGIAAVGMDDVRDDADVSLRRLYTLHPSKRALVGAWLEDRHVRWMSWFTTTVEHGVRSGKEPVVAVFDTIEEWALAPGYRGCAFLNAIAETTEIDDTHRAIAARHKQSLLTYLSGIAARSLSAPPQWLPGALGVLIDGAIVQSIVLATTTPITDARHAASRLLESLR